MKFDPPISSRDTDELIGIANGTTEHWQQEAIDQAKKELERRQIPIEYQIKMMEKWDAEIKAFEDECEKSHNEFLKIETKKGYTGLQKLGIFIFAPFILAGKIENGLSLWELKKDGYKKKFWQRLILLLLGLIFWITFIFSAPYLFP